MSFTHRVTLGKLLLNESLSSAVKGDNIYLKGYCEESINEELGNLINVGLHSANMC